MGHRYLTFNYQITFSNNNCVDCTHIYTHFYIPKYNKHVRYVEILKKKTSIHSSYEQVMSRTVDK